ncbi:hypothetical protein OAL24_00792 [Oenococcus sicerae]|nr:hypothetical protein OAL24_00792 [Oenococcus sicerae]
MPETKANDSPSKTVFFSPMILIINGLNKRKIIIPKLGTVNNVSTAALDWCLNAPYINGRAEEIAGAIIVINEMDSSDTLNIHS